MNITEVAERAKVSTATVSRTINGSNTVSLETGRVLERKVDGVGIMTSEMEEGLVAELEKRLIPIVFLDTGKVRSRISNIRVDYGREIRAAMAHLVQLRRIGFISGPLTFNPGIRKSG